MVHIMITKDPGKQITHTTSSSDTTQVVMVVAPPCFNSLGDGGGIPGESDSLDLLGNECEEGKSSSRELHGDSDEMFIRLVA